MESNKTTQSYVLKKTKKQNNYKAWLLLEGRAGDDKQLLDIINLLKWQAIPVKLNTSIFEIVIQRFFGPRLFLKKIIKRQLPDPDAIFIIGGRNASVAHAIKKNSGNKIKLYAMGRPFAPFAWFDLIITTPQYCLPKSPKTIELPLPISIPDVDSNKLEKWERLIDKVNKPKICVLLGGNNSNYYFNSTFTANLCKSLTSYAKQKNAILLITNSPRTPQQVTNKLKKELGQSHIFYDINHKNVSNPYWMFIKVSQEVLVTSDSVSMISDAYRNGKLVRIIALPNTIWDKLIQKLQMINSAKSKKMLKSCLSYLVTKGIWTPPRNIKNLHNRLVEEKKVVWFDDKLPGSSIKSVENTYNYNNLINILNRNIQNKINDY